MIVSNGHLPRSTRRRFHSRRAHRASGVGSRGRQTVLQQFSARSPLLASYQLLVLADHLTSRVCFSFRLQERAVTKSSLAVPRNDADELPPRRFPINVDEDRVDRILYDRTARVLSTRSTVGRESRICGAGHRTSRASSLLRESLARFGRLRSMTESTATAAEHRRGRALSRSGASGARSMRTHRRSRVRASIGSRRRSSRSCPTATR